MQAMIQALVSDLTGQEAETITIKLRPALDYQSNHLYDVHFGDTRWMAKVFLKTNEFSTSPAWEYRNLQLLAPHDIAPQPIAYFAHPQYPQPIVIYEFLTGEMVDRRPLTHEQMRSFADLWLTINSVTSHDMGYSRRWDEFRPERFAYWDGVYEEYIGWATKHMPAAVLHVRAAYALYTTHADTLATVNPEILPDDTLRFCHADPRFANLIQRPDSRFGYVDWEDGGLRDPAFSIADMMVQPNQEDTISAAHWQTFLEVYCAGRDFDEAAFRARIDAYKIGAILFWFGGLLRYGVHKWQAGEDMSAFRINSMPANQRLRRYLARALETVSDDSMADLLAQYEADDVCFFPDSEQK